ncbi:MAG: UDP-N-acetylglucosamine pyrophosphorylase [Pirellulaceae bacterium]|nr:MAG: UDP-N-acetylglucosamine pyrophosphorylase [Pirellulaceae bacterium]
MDTTSEPLAIVLAAGRGTRMKSDLPKVLVPVLGRPMILWVLDALATAGINRAVVVVGYQAPRVQETLASRPGLQFALQEEQLGTGHAVQICRQHIQQHDGPVLVVAGDSPLIQADSIRELLDHFRRDGGYACLLGTLLKDDPTGLGRIVRDSHGRFARIVEHKDATPEQLSIREVNMSTYLFDSSALLTALDGLTNNNAQREYYLTDCPEILLRAGHRVDALPVLRPCEALSINTVEELQVVEHKMREMGYAEHA